MIEPIGNQPIQPPTPNSDWNNFQKIINSDGMQYVISSYVNHTPGEPWSPQDLLAGSLQALQPYGAVIGGSFNATLQQLQTDFNANNFSGVNNDYQALVKIPFGNISDADFNTATGNALRNFQTMVSENNNQGQVEGFYGYVFSTLLADRQDTNMPLERALGSDSFTSAYSNYMGYQGTPPYNLQDELALQIGLVIPLTNS